MVAGVVGGSYLAGGEALVVVVAGGGKLVRFF
jgi:hypothetical protein